MQHTLLDITYPLIVGYLDFPTKFGVAVMVVHVVNKLS
jgi:hypothetical protein